MWYQIWSSVMESNPNGPVKKLKYLDQGTNDINVFLYILKYNMASIKNPSSFYY